jgi:hypothetical protein
MVATGEQTLTSWRRLNAPPTIDGEIATVLDLYQEGLGAYDEAYIYLSNGLIDEAGISLRQGDRISAEYRELAREAGFRECDGALPL